jgi:outer membrane protein TolC
MILLHNTTAAAAGADAADPVLSPARFVQAVLTRNPQIKAKESGHDAALAAITSAGALDDPMLTYLSAPRTIGAGIGYRQIVQASQKIPWPGTLHLRTEAAAAAAKSAEYQVIDTRLRLASRARATYAAWYYVYQALAINQETTALVAHLKAVAESAYASGEASQQDVLQAEVELTRLQNQALEIERRRQAVQAEIDSLLDSSPATPVASPGALPTPVTTPSFAQLSAAALAQYPALESADAEIAAGEDRVALARKAYYPNFQLMVGENTLWNATQERFTVGLEINVPIGGKHDGDLDEAHAKLRESRYERAGIRDSLMSDLEKTYAALQQAGETVRLYDERLLPLSKLNLKAATADYSAGRGDFLKVITAEQEYLMTRLERARARADYYTQSAALDYETGGVIFSEQRPGATP